MTLTVRPGSMLTCPCCHLRHFADLPTSRFGSWRSLWNLHRFEAQSLVLAAVRHCSSPPPQSIPLIAVHCWSCNCGTLLPRLITWVKQLAKDGSVTGSPWIFCAAVWQNCFPLLKRSAFRHLHAEPAAWKHQCWGTLATSPTLCRYFELLAEFVKRERYSGVALAEASDIIRLIKRWA